MHKIIGTLVVLGALIVPAGALADSSGDGSGYGTQPGFTQSNSNTTCAGHGAFGALGKDNSQAGGSNGYQTGFNNSYLCGNRQGNL